MLTVSVLGAAGDGAWTAPPASGWEVASAHLEQDGTTMRVTYRNGQVTVTHIQHQQTGFEVPQISQDRRSVG